MLFLCLHVVLGGCDGVLARSSSIGQDVMPKPWEGAIAARVTHNPTPGPQNGTFPE